MMGFLAAPSPGSSSGCLSRWCWPPWRSCGPGAPPSRAPTTRTLTEGRSPRPAIVPSQMHCTATQHITQVAPSTRRDREQTRLHDAPRALCRRTPTHLPRRNSSSLRRRIHSTPCRVAAHTPLCHHCITPKSGTSARVVGMGICRSPLSTTRTWLCLWDAGWRDGDGRLVVAMETGGWSLAAAWD